MSERELWEPEALIFVSRCMFNAARTILIPQGILADHPDAAGCHTDDNLSLWRITPIISTAPVANDRVWGKLEVVARSAAAALKAAARFDERHAEMTTRRDKGDHPASWYENPALFKVELLAGEDCSDLAEGTILTAIAKRPSILPPSTSTGPATRAPISSGEDICHA
jgi:hypothetical protein